LGRAPHNQTVTNDYFNYLIRELKNATVEDIPSILADIANELANGAEFRNNIPLD